MLARVRVSVPDKPGSLGKVASAIGAAGGDIAAVDVLENEAGRALDDVFVHVRDVTHLTQVGDSLRGVAGVSVIGLQHPAPPTTGHAELELAQQVLSHPQRAIQTLVDGAPGALGADWAAIVLFGPAGAADEVVAMSTRCPGLQAVSLTAPLRLAAVRLSPPDSPTPYSGAVLVPLGDSPLGLVLVRESGVEFHRSELWRLAQLGSVVATVVPVLSP